MFGLRWLFWWALDHEIFVTPSIRHRHHVFLVHRLIAILSNAVHRTGLAKERYWNLLRGLHLRVLSRQHATHCMRLVGLKCRWVLVDLLQFFIRPLTQLIIDGAIFAHDGIPRAESRWLLERARATLASYRWLDLRFNATFLLIGVHRRDSNHVCQVVLVACRLLLWVVFYTRLLAHHWWQFYIEVTSCAAVGPWVHSYRLWLVWVVIRGLAILACVFVNQFRLLPVEKGHLGRFMVLGQSCGIGLYFWNN